MKSILLRLLLILLLAIPIYLYRDYFLRLPVLDGREALKASRPDVAEDPYLDSLDKRQRDLELNELFWQQRTNTRIPDNYSLSLSLYDSSIWLDYNGIIIHKAKITSYLLSPDIELKRKSKDIKTWLRSSFTLTEEWATVPKEPIRTKDIRRNKNQSDSLDFRPSDIDSTDIMVVLFYTKNLKIGFKQRDLSQTGSVLLGKQEFRNKSAIKMRTSSDLQMPYFQLLTGDWISVDLASTDLISIYRALKLNSRLVLGL
jgi:hypothetical protein